MTTREYCNTCCKSDVCEKMNTMHTYEDLSNEVLKKIEAEDKGFFKVDTDFIIRDIRCKHYQEIKNTLRTADTSCGGRPME
jgi:hypothetical protein